MTTSRRPVGYRWYVAVWAIAIVLICSMVAAWIYRGLLERQSAVTISALGARVMYANSPAWLRVVRGPARSGSVLGVDFTGTEVADGDLAHLQHLWRLRSLDLRGTQVSDTGLKHIESLSALASLELRGTSATTASLMGLSSRNCLKSLGLNLTELSDADIERLGEFPHLQELYLIGPTSSSDARAARALPGVSIRRNPLVDESTPEQLAQCTSSKKCKLRWT